jgi:hypothetical protein
MWPLVNDPRGIIEIVPKTFPHRLICLFSTDNWTRVKIQIEPSRENRNGTSGHKKKKQQKRTEKKRKEKKTNVCGPLKKKTKPLIN